MPAAGDYMLSFTANMVSSNSQAIWCALYKQSPGDEGWQVLGMINNYQRDAGEEDDRDSGSLSLLATLKEGDQVAQVVGPVLPRCGWSGGGTETASSTAIRTSSSPSVATWSPVHRRVGHTSSRHTDILPHRSPSMSSSKSSKRVLRGWLSP